MNFIKIFCVVPTDTGRPRRISLNGQAGSHGIESAEGRRAPLGCFTSGHFEARSLSCILPRSSPRSSRSDSSFLPFPFPPFFPFIFLFFPPFFSSSPFYPSPTNRNARPKAGPTRGRPTRSRARFIPPIPSPRAISSPAKSHFDYLLGEAYRLLIYSRGYKLR